MAENYEVVISNKAKEMLGKHIRFLAQVNKTAAKEKKREIILAIESLRDNPNRYPFLNVPYITQDKYHKMFVEKWYLIIYQVKDKVVYVDYVLDCRKDYKWLI